MVDKLKEWLNINELAEKTLIPDTSVRRYISKFPDFFQSKGGSRSKRYEDSGIKVLVRIKNLFDSGYETDQVDEVLRKEFPVIIDGNKVEESEEKASTPPLATVEDVEEIKAMLVRQQEFNERLLERLAEQERYIKNSLEKRDNQLIESLRTVQELKQAQIEVSSSVVDNDDKEDKESKPNFFQRLFGNK
jgi:DNA-binding transcriptional MerR regulator